MVQFYYRYEKNDLNNLSQKKLFHFHLGFVLNLKEYFQFQRQEYVLRYLKKRTNQTLNLTTNLASSPADNAALTFTKGHMWTVGTHLTSQSGIAAISGNEYLGDFTVDANDRITLDVPVSSMSCGFKYDSVLKTMPIDVAIQGQPLTARYKRIVRCILDIQDAIDVDIEGQDLKVRQVSGSIGSGSLTRTAVNGVA